MGTKNAVHFSRLSYNLVRPFGIVPLASQQAGPPTADKLGQRNASFDGTSES